MGKREDNQRLKRERIVAAAKALFSKRGYDATTTRAIAKRAHVAHGTLFLYAKTRADVVGLVFESEIGTALSRALATAPSSTSSSSVSVTDLCMHLYGAFIDVYGRDAALARVLVKELPWLEGRMKETMRTLTFECLGAIATAVVARQAEGRMRDDVIAAAFAASTFSLYYGALTAWLSAELGSPSAVESKSAALALLTEGLGLLEKGACP